MHELMHERTHTSQGTVERRSPRVVGLTRALRAATATAALVAPLAAPAQFVTGLQGPWDAAFPGSPAQPHTGSLVRFDDDGRFTVVASGLDRPTSMQLIGTTA